MLFAVFAPKFHVIQGGALPARAASGRPGSSRPPPPRRCPISWGPFVGDYGRYIPASAPSWMVSAYAVHRDLPPAAGSRWSAAAFAATAFPAQAGNFVHRYHRRRAGLVPVPAAAGASASAPTSPARPCRCTTRRWTSASWPFFYRFKRCIITACSGWSLFGLTYLFVVATNFLTNLEAFVTIMIVTATPWMVIIGIEFVLSRNDSTPASTCTRSPSPGCAGSTGSRTASTCGPSSPGLCGAGARPHVLHHTPVHRAAGELGQRRRHVLAGGRRSAAGWSTWRCATHGAGRSACPGPGTRTWPIPSRASQAWTPDRSEGARQ